MSRLLMQALNYMKKSPFRCETCGCFGHTDNNGDHKTYFCICRKNKFYICKHGYCDEWQKEKWHDPNLKAPDSPLFDPHIEKMFGGN